MVFCVATSEYDQKLYEDEEVARVDESLQLFDSIVNSRWFISSTIICAIPACPLRIPLVLTRASCAQCS